MRVKKKFPMRFHVCSFILQRLTIPERIEIIGNTVMTVIPECLCHHYHFLGLEYPVHLAVYKQLNSHLHTNVDFVQPAVVIEDVPVLSQLLMLVALLEAAVAPYLYLTVDQIQRPGDLNAKPLLQSSDVLGLDPMESSFDAHLQLHSFANDRNNGCSPIAPGGPFTRLFVPDPIGPKLRVAVCTSLRADEVVGPVFEVLFARCWLLVGLCIAKPLGGAADEEVWLALVDGCPIGAGGLMTPGDTASATDEGWETLLLLELVIDVGAALCSTADAPATSPEPGDRAAAGIVPTGPIPLSGKMANVC
uniref:Uncharacterized protein n=1 Tax=Glossina austeni TaxID=7395 RepID=A0A1A9UZ10_GLOAU